MDRTIFYPALILDDEDLLAMQQDPMVALGVALASIMGTGTVASGLACTPTSPASLAAVVGLGAITQLGVVEANAFGSLPVDTTPLVKQGWLGETPVTFPFTAPTTPGQSVAYLIEATLSETDGGSAVEPFYNAANPSQAFAGPGNSGDALNTRRLQRCVLKLVPGAAANTGSQVTPAADTGYVPLYVVTLSYGQTSVVAANIVQHPQAPFFAYRLPTLPNYFVQRGHATGATQEDNYTLPNNGAHTITLTFTSTVPGVIAAWASTNISGQAPGINQLGVTINGITPAADRTPFPMSVSGVVPVGAGLNTISSTYSTSSSGNPNCGHTLSYLFVPN